MADKTNEKDYAWKDEQEKILKIWADKALCFKMMHERAYKKYWCLNAWFNIPVIVISTLTGTGNFASSSLGNNSSAFIFALGALNISSGILATVASYTGVAQKLEAHRFSSIHWDKFSRKLQIELAKSRIDRVKAKDFIKQAAEEYDRLIEMSPILPNTIIRWFSNMTETGEFEEDLGNCETCCFECFCFPCGCNYCSCFSCCTRKKKHIQTDTEIESKNLWKEMELPEIIGRIKPTEIARDDTILPVPVIKEKEDESYNIYNSNQDSMA
jgi:hypothetical protein